MKVTCSHTQGDYSLTEEQYFLEYAGGCEVSEWSKHILRIFLGGGLILKWLICNQIYNQIKLYNNALE